MVILVDQIKEGIIDFERTGEGRIIVKCDNTNCKSCSSGRCMNYNMIDESNKKGYITCEEGFVNFKLPLCQKPRVEVKTDLGGMNDPVDRRIYVDGKTVGSMSNDHVDGDGNAIDLLNNVLSALGIRMKRTRV